MSLPANDELLGALKLHAASQTLDDCNHTSAAYGLALTQDEVTALQQRRHEALAQNDRVEFRGGALPLLVEAFASSPFLQQSDYAETLGELLDIFYPLRADIDAQIPDTVILAALRAAFDERAGGSIEELAALGAREILQTAAELDLTEDERDEAADESSITRLVDDEGRVYTWDPQEWRDDIFAPGWNGESWEEGLEQRALGWNDDDDN